MPGQMFQSRDKSPQRLGVPPRSPVAALYFVTVLYTVRVSEIVPFGIVFECHVSVFSVVYRSSRNGEVFTEVRNVLLHSRLSTVLRSFNQAS